MPKHSHILHELPDYLTSKLDEESKGRIDEHLKVCASCRAELEELRALIDAGRSHPAWDPATRDEYWDSVLPRLKTRLGQTEPSSGAWLTIPPWVEQILAPSAAVALGILLIIRYVAMEPGEVAERPQDDELRAIVASIPEDELSEIIEPNAVPQSGVPAISDSDEHLLLSTLLAEDYDPVESRGLFDVSRISEVLSDREVEEVLKRMEREVHR